MSVINLGSLGSRGLLINGNGDYSQLGWSVSQAGDVNGDGIDDFIVGRLYTAQGLAPGGAYVFFGKAGGLGPIDLSNLSPSDGFFMQGPSNSHIAGEVVAGGGDINGDGFDDVMIADPRFNNYMGETFAVYGKAGTSGTVALGTMPASQGFTITNNLSGVWAGLPLAFAGDINHDGYDDMLIGTQAHRAYVLYGKPAGSSAIALNPLDPANGFMVQGNGINDFVGSGVTGLGDFNGDGIDDFAIGALGANKTYIVFGKAGGFANLNLNNLTAADGLVITGTSAGPIGYSISGAGDVNGDGLQDIILGTVGSADRAYVVFGRSGGNVDLNSLGSAGLLITGSPNTSFGFDVSGAGDVNGDGFDDVIVGVLGQGSGGSYSGGAYVIYGRNGSGTIDATALADADGYFLQAQAGDNAGHSVSSAGDVNGDGFDDVLVGAQRRNAGGYAAGGVYLVYGEMPTTDVTRIGSLAGQTIRGGTGNDLLDGQQGDDRLYGGAGSDHLIGGSGNDTLDGGAGADTLEGGTGDDIYVVDDAADTVTEAAGEGSDGVLTSLAVYALGANIENLAGLSASGQTLIGNGDHNVIAGWSGNDVIDGGAGNDLMLGGLGNDIYYVDHPGDIVTELAGQGNADEVRTTLGSYTLLPNVENLTGLSASGQALTGNGDANVITGGAGDDAIDGGAGADTLIGGAGADSMTGGAGDDIFYVDNSGDVVTENAGEGNADEVRTTLSGYVLPANVERLTWIGTGGGDLRGNGLDNVLTGGAGNDFVRAQDGGNDTVSLGAGNDAVIFGASYSSADIVDGGSGSDQVGLQGDYSGGVTLGTLTGVETLAIMTHSDARFGGGSASPYSYNIVAPDSTVAAGTQLMINASTLQAGENLTFDGHAETNGSFFIYGGKGVDTLTGGNGADVFFFAEDGRFAATDHIDGGAGQDVMVLRGNYSLVLSGTSLVNVETVVLNSGSDARFYAAGTPFSYDIATADDTVAAGQTMTFNGGALSASETLHFDGSLETNGNFRLFGGSSSDVIKGGAGNDLIYGGLGQDDLTGGAGADTFRYQGAGESTATATDRILDFATGDIIDLGRIDAVPGGGDDAFNLVGAFDGHAGQLVLTQGANNVWTVSGDTDGNGQADFQILVTVSDGHQLGSSDFVL
jgi:Ca2+-binding RTX toxin-like protein